MIDELFEAAPVGLGTLGRDGRWVTVNPAMAMLIQRPREEIVGSRPSELTLVLGGEVERHAQRVLETGEPAALVMAGTLPTDPGRTRAWDVAFFPLPEGVGCAAVEVTERRRAELELAEAHRRDALMARAGHLLSTALDLQQTADLVARLAVPELADWCFVELVQPDGSIRRTALAHRDPARERWAWELSERYQLDPNSPVGSPKVIRTGEPELYEDIPDELLQAAAIDEHHLEALRTLGFRSACIVPLVARGRVLGDLALASGPEAERPVTRETLAIAQALAERCALALDNAALYAQRDLVAVSLQEELLPRELPAVPGLDVAARYSAAGEGNDVGGDFYDVFASGDGSWHVVIGDVVGKGPVAAAVTGLARHTLRASATYEQRPSELLRDLNRALMAEQPGRRMATVACVRLTAGDGVLHLTLSAAGHPLPLIVSPDGSVREAGAYGAMLGVASVLEAVDTEDVLRRGELLFLYTDGVVDARGPGGLFGEDRLRALLTGLSGNAPSRVVQRIDNAVLAHSGGRPRDDVAMIALSLGR